MDTITLAFRINHLSFAEGTMRAVLIVLGAAVVAFFLIKGIQAFIAERGTRKK